MIHPLSDVQTSNIGENTNIWQFCVVLKGASIGVNSTILPGVIIGENAIIGAGAIVTKNVDSGITIKGK